MKDKERNGTLNRNRNNDNYESKHHENKNESNNFKCYKGKNNPFNLPNFFDKKEYKIHNPYNFGASLERLKILENDYFFNDMESYTKKEFDLEFSLDEKFKCNLESVMILTHKKDKENDNFFNFIKLVDFNKYCHSSAQDNFRMSLNNLGKKKEIVIKAQVDFDQVSENFSNVFNNEVPFEKSRNLVNMAKINFTGNKKNPEIDIVIRFNTVKKIYETSNQEFLILELNNPPHYKTNFLKVSDKNNNKMEYENALFPFRNFEDETVNLKYRKFFLILKLKTPTGEQKENDKDNIFVNQSNQLKNLLEVVSEKIETISCKINEESEIRKKYKLNLELNDYFQKYKYKFIDYQFDEQTLINFNYLILVLVSENILTYFNAIEFMERIVSHKDNYFNDNYDNENFLNFVLIEALIKLIEHYKNTEIDLTINHFEEEIKSNYNSCKLEYEVKKEKAFKKKNTKLIRNMRVIVTPTYTLFMPIIEDQGNRILREHRKPHEAMRLVFKMDDFEDARWNNRFLKEFIKLYLCKGVGLVDINYGFFCYSQSQFRSMGCWLVKDPDEIIDKTGDYSNIKIVAKYGARLGQTLTSTVKTIKIHENNIKYIEDVKRNGYVFSDGVGTISFDLALKICKKLDLEEVPAAFQGRFLGCKGVWTVLFNDTSSTISIRPSQNKFNKKAEGKNQRFEVCSYSKFIKSYLNRQIILLLSALGIKNDILMKKLMLYRDRLEDEKFILSLIHFEEWNSSFLNMFYSGVNRTNDRLIQSIVSANKEILYRDLKKRARIYIEEGAYVIGIMDEFNILESGEAFLSIRDGKFEMILDKDCTVAKCPCLHPGDIRKLNFRKYHSEDESTHKYKILEQYENVIIFPQNGDRPHPNELSGSDLDGDQYFVFYDSDLTRIKTKEAMDYSDNSKTVEVESITRNDVINYFADYINSNNLGLISDAHLAQSDKSGADADIPKALAKKFARAVDAPKTGEEVCLDEGEEPESFPHYMGKDRNSKRSNHILGKLYDKTLNFIEDIDKFKSLNHKFYDESLLLTNHKNFIFEGLIYYIEYYEELLGILKKNDIKCESELLTGNNVDSETPGFGKKKSNHDLIEKLQIQMKDLFIKNKNYFNFSSQHILGDLNIHLRDNLNNCNSVRASAFYYTCYDILKIIEDFTNNEQELDHLKWNFQSEIFKDTLYETFEGKDEFCNYSNLMFGGDYMDQVYAEELYVTELEKRKIEIREKLEKWKNLIYDFIFKKMKTFDLPKSAEKENQFRILSFPWCAAGDILIRIKELVR